MDFVSVMLFTKQVFHLECFLLFHIKSEPGVADKSAVYKGAFNVVFKSPKKEKITLLREFIFVFIWYLIGTILSEESCQKREVWKKYKMWGWPIREGVSLEKGFKPSAYCDIERIKGETLKPWITGGTSSYNAKINTLAGGFTDRTSSMLEEIASKNVHKGKEGDWLRKKK